MPRSAEIEVPRRVAVLGMPGAGKSVLAGSLGEALDAPVFHLDAIYWKPGWVASSWDEFRARQAELLKLDTWVLDGNYSTGGLRDRLDRADVVVIVMAPRLVTLWRIVRRSLRHRGQTRPDMGDGKPERVSPEFLRWVWNWRRTHPDFAETVRSEAGDKPVIVLRTRADADRFIEDMRGKVAARRP